MTKAPSPAVFVEIHALRSFPPANLNRDDLGTPKTAVFGGARRLRISSQCLKRSWRESLEFRGAFADGQLGVRTARMPGEVLAQLGDSFDEAARDGLLALLASLGTKTKKGKDDDGDDEDGEDAGGPAGEAEIAVDKTKHLLFLSRQEIEAVTSFAKEEAEGLRKVFAAKKGKKTVDTEVLKGMRKKLGEHLARETKRNAVDVGLFGRFVTSDEFDTIDGALQVAHALGTQKVEVEYDYFTAVDDLGGGEPGAGHLGESEFASSVLYLYACCDLGQLERNLGQRSGDKRIVDAEAKELARRSLGGITRAMARSVPKGKRTGTAPNTPAEFIEVVVRRGAPLSLANAFTSPVEARDGDVMETSITNLLDHRERLETAYARADEVVFRGVLCLRDLKDLRLNAEVFHSLDALSAKLVEAIATKAAE